MDLETFKIELIRMIQNIENPKLISLLSDFLKRASQDFWDELSEPEKREIKIGLEQLNKGDRIDFDEFIKKVS